MTQDLFPTTSFSVEDLNTTVNHEPRISHVKLADLLGYRFPHKVAELITRHKAALERLGELIPTVGVNHTEIAARGRPASTWWLSKRQALFVCTKSETPNATEATIRMVEVFDAVTAGRLPAPASAPAEKQEPPRTVPVRAHVRALPAPEVDPGPQSLSIDEALALLDPPYRWMTNVSMAARTLPLIRALIVILRARLRHAELAASAVHCAIGDPADIRATRNDIGRER